MPRSFTWTPDEVAVLRQSIKNELSYEAIWKLLPNHSKASICSKRRALGLEYLAEDTVTEPHWPSRQKFDMVNLPKHKNGREVCYA